MRNVLFSSILGLSLLGAAPINATVAADISGPISAPVESPLAFVQGTGLTAVYFSNGSLAGAPVLKRLDAAVDFRWGMGSPAEELPADNFSVRWEGLVSAPSTGNYKFAVNSPDGVRLWVNGRKVLDTWNGRGSMKIDGATISLAAGEKTTIKLEYYNEDGEARVQLQWMPPGQATQPIPSTNLYPVGSPTTPDLAGPAKPAVAATVAPARAAAAPTKITPAADQPADKSSKKAAAVAKAAPVAAPVATTPAATALITTTKSTAKPGGAPISNPTKVVSGNVYTLRDRANGTALEVADDSRPFKSSQVRMSAPHWRIESVGDGGYYRLLVQGSSKVMEVLGSSTSNGAAMDLWNYYSGNNQLWKIEDAGDGYYKLIAKHSHKALTAKDSVDGGIQQWRYTGKENQQWRLDPATVEVAATTTAKSSIPAIGANHMSVYPNPSNGVVQMNYQLGEEMPLGWVLYDQRGIVVRVSDYRRQASGPHNQTLDFTGLPAGDYNLHLTVGTNTTKQPLSIRRPKAEGSGQATAQ
ncbi:RICIN domain-containing protein [Hymenobacter mucosus]|uniref:Por secretion system C-terminal sorting domain-containing protein n=2 Tax=Hymenobacter TaxID=89966 RepID=A0A238X1D2_9BACT|nr:RICIN domain-containing protein [Hymenobacter mucosus]SNR52383.1 Por secretion system C-terminal sorting domain-containing protein [Hymenobacter mucosus]